MNEVAIGIGHPGAAPNVTAGALQAVVSARARRALRWRACHGPIALAIAVVPAALAFAPGRLLIERALLLALAGVTFVIVRALLRQTLKVARFEAREQDCRRRWEAALAQWQAEAGPGRFDAKVAELERLEEWWESANPAQRPTIQDAIRRTVDELRQIAYRIEIARTSLRAPTEAAYGALLQAQLDLKTVGHKR